jgi:hypothetical protein
LITYHFTKVPGSDTIRNNPCSSRKARPVTTSLAIVPAATTLERELQGIVKSLSITLIGLAGGLYEGQVLSTVTTEPDYKDMSLPTRKTNILTIASISPLP